MTPRPCRKCENCSKQRPCRDQITDLKCAVCGGPFAVPIFIAEFVQKQRVTAVQCDSCRDGDRADPHWSDR